MLLETTLIVEDLVAQVDIFHFASEEEPKEKAVDPGQQAGQECAAGEEERGWFKDGYIWESGTQGLPWGQESLPV